jgi:hypothetical protein
VRCSLPLLAVLAIFAGCGSSDRAQRMPTVEGAPAASLEVLDPLLVAEAQRLPARVDPRPVPACVAGDEVRMRTSRKAYAAVVRVRTEAYARPGGRTIEAFELLNANGYPTVFGVLSAVVDAACEPVWYRVQLPIRPNGSIGYVRASDVELAAVKTRVEIDLSERRLRFFRAGKLLLDAPVAIGAPTTPTPTGRYYVNQRLVAPDPWGPFGPAAIGVSAFSPVLQDWIQGGPIAIHGTNDPESIGNAASHGCLRLRNDLLVWLFKKTRAGTPVEIVA